MEQTGFEKEIIDQLYKHISEVNSVYKKNKINKVEIVTLEMKEKALQIVRTMDQTLMNLNGIEDLKKAQLKFQSDIKSLFNKK